MSDATPNVKAPAGPVAVKKIVLYIGDDLTYWTAIQERFKASYPQFELQTLYDKNGNYQLLFLKLLQIKPTIIYIDITKDIEVSMGLAQLLARDNSTSQIPLVGLIDKQEGIKDCISIGLDFIHVKCAEFHDVVYDPVRVAFPKETTSPKFAKAKFQHDSILIEDFRVGYIGATGLHAEGNCQLDEGQELEAEYPLPRTIMQSKKMMVRKVTSSNLYYDYQYAYDLDFKFVDPPKENNENEAVEQKSAQAQKFIDSEKKQIKAEYENELRTLKIKFKQWVKTNSQEQQQNQKDQKKTKILIIDKDLKIFKKSSRPLDQYPYVIRCQTKLSDDLTELDKIRPNLIAFQFDEFNDSELVNLTEEEIAIIKEKETKLLTIISTIIQAAKLLDKYNPFVVVFNCSKYTSTSFQNSYKYPLILVNKEDMSLDVILNLATLYDDKQEKKTKELITNKILGLRKENPSKYSRLTPADFQEPKYYLSKKNILSFISISHVIKIVSLSESEISFETERVLRAGVYRMNFPTPMSITIVADRDSGKLYVESKNVRTYQGLIHSVAENQKKKIRQYVNELFFGPLMDKKGEEADVLAAITEEALKKKTAEKAIALENIDLDNPDGAAKGGANE